MTNSQYTVESNWRENDAAALEHRAEVLNQWLDYTEDIIEMLENEDERIRMSLLSTAGLIRSLRTDITSEAGKLRAEVLSRQT